MNSFKFGLGARVKITESGERGVVKGRAEFTNSTNSYYVHYTAGDGRAVSVWWEEDIIQIDLTP